MSVVIRGGFPFVGERHQSALVRAEGMYVFDQDGKRYADLCSGLWNMPLGYSNERIKSHVKKQLEKLPFSNLLAFFSDIQEQYAQRLIDWMGDFAYVLYTCSGSEAIEAAIKTCRKYQALKNRPERKKIAAFSLSYHGTSYGAMSVSGIDQILARDYAPLLSDISWLPLPADWNSEKEWTENIDCLFQKNGEQLAGFLVEPVLASGGVIPVPVPVLEHLQNRCQEYGTLLVVDEVATGFGRTGVPFAYQRAGLSPDLVCLSKAINNGYLPLGALLYGRTCAEIFTQKQACLEHFSTQGGNAVAVAAAMGLLECMQEYACFQVQEKGAFFLRLLQEGLQSKANVRGCGLMLAVDFPEKFDGMEVLHTMELFKKRGLIVNMYNNEPYNRGISLFPPFLITQKEIETYSQQILTVLCRLL